MTSLSVEGTVVTRLKYCGVILHTLPPNLLPILLPYPPEDVCLFSTGNFCVLILGQKQLTGVTF